MEQAQRPPIVNAVVWYLSLLLDRQNIASATNDDQITQDGLDNLTIVKQAEADQFKQDLG